MRTASRGADWRRVPVWLRRLGAVKVEMRGVRFPRSAEDGLRQLEELSALALRALREQVRAALPGASPARVENATRVLLTRLAAARAGWASRWKRERARYFDR